MIDLRTIAQALGGKVSGREVLCPTPGHSSQDRGTSIRLAPDAPDGLLVTCFNGGRAEALAVKDTLREAGLLPSLGGKPRILTHVEREAVKQAEAERLAERLAGHLEAACICRQRLAQARSADPVHTYLARKHIAPERLWQAGNDLLVPMTDLSGALWNIQTIAPDGFKRFAKGARVKGLIWRAGQITESKQLVIGEGMATVAAIRRATGLPVVAAMTAGNLPAVATAIHSSRPDLRLVIAADDDAAGMKAAREASQLTGAAVALPEISQ
ncbi:MAG: hypothetical protein RIQ99_386 [Pseudomonadota bacterium]|jgi:phage/plasmid primase-like uncharacterized protein